MRNQEIVQVLFVHPDSTACRAVELYFMGFSRSGLSIRSASTPEEIASAADTQWDVVLLDGGNGNGAGRALVSQAEESLNSSPFVRFGGFSENLITQGDETSSDGFFPAIEVNLAPLLRSAGNLLERRSLDHKVGELQETVKSASKVDAVVGLWNRTYFNERMAEEFIRSRRYKTPLTLCYFGIQGFERIMQTYGFRVTDEVLSTCGKIVHEGIREPDFAGRIGSGRFAIVFNNTGVTGGLVGLERIRDRIRRKIFTGKQSENFGIDVRYGVAGMTESHEDLDALWTEARESYAKAQALEEGHIEVPFAL